MTLFLLLFAKFTYKFEDGLLYTPVNYNPSSRKCGELRVSELDSESSCLAWVLARVIAVCKEARHFTLTVWRTVGQRDKIQEDLEKYCEGLGNHALPGRKNTPSR